ncbi:MAG TPA: HIT domain-containing protein, partial [Candidatus Bilophila faecipullorum]|nr:HIT domain-containing protein [Candidatus Bilophila faecipullorum]
MAEPQQADCIFCRIARGDIPSTSVYETDELLAFLDINPVSKGHTLVVPKAHMEALFDMPSALGG